MKRLLFVGSVVVFLFGMAACGASSLEDSGDEMSFSEEEVSEGTGEEIELTEAEIEGGDEMEFTEEELEGDDELEFTEEEVDSDVQPDGMENIILGNDEWLLTYEPGYVQCGTGPAVEGAASRDEFVLLNSLVDGSGFGMLSYVSDETYNFNVVYSNEFLDPFADNIVNYTHPADNLLAFNTAAYQTAFEEGGASFYMIFFPLNEVEMIGTFWALQDDCQLEKGMTLTRSSDVD